MSTEWLVPHLLTFVEFAVAVLLGYGFGCGVRKALHQNVVELRAELKAREELLTERSKREDKMVKACMERLGVSVTTDTGSPNERVDLSREAVAAGMEADRRQRVQDNQEEWQEEFESQRQDVLG